MSTGKTVFVAFVLCEMTYNLDARGAALNTDKGLSYETDASPLKVKNYFVLSIQFRVFCATKH